MGWKINVLDACDKAQPGFEPSAAAATEDLQSRGSIQYTTRVKPDVENERFYNSNEPTRNYVDPPAIPKHHNMPSVPYAMEENLKNDFHRSPPTDRDRFVHNGGRESQPPSAVSQKNFTLYSYPNSNYTYGNGPFYMPNGVPYGSPQPMKYSSIYNYPSVPTHNNNNNYRPIRQPAIPVYHAAAQPNALLPKQRPMQMVYVHKQPAKHGYRVTTGKRLPPNGGGPMPNGAHHSVVYKKPVYKFNNAQPVSVPVTHYNPVPPVSQPMIPVYPGNHFQHYQHHQQQQQPLLQQPSTSVSQSVSVSYSSSKHQKPAQHVPVGYMPIQNRQETVGQHYQSHKNGFNHNKVVVEGGFKPIVPTTDGGFLLDRSDQQSGEADDFDETTTVRHPEKKISKKLISRKPAVKHADPAVTMENAEEQRQDTIDTTTAENFDHENGSIAENAEETKQTADIVV